MATIPTIPLIYKKPTVYDQTAVFYWRTPSSNGGSNILSYTIECSSISYSKVVSATSYFLKVSGLTNGTNYSFTIKATNGVGDSPIATFDSFIPGVKTKQPFTINPNVIVSNIVSLDWNNQYYGWSPKNIGNISLWIDLFDTTTYTTNGSNLISIIDKSPSNNTITLSNVTPSFNQKLINNKPGITFNGNNWLRGNFNQTYTGNTYSVFAIGSVSSTVVNDARLVSFSTTGNLDTISTSLAPIIKYSNTQNFCSYKGGYAVSRSISYNTNMLFSSIYDSTQIKNGNNGTYSTGATTGNLLLNNWGVGYMADYGGTNQTTYWNGNFGEVIVYLGKLTSVEQQLLEGYLAWKWNINNNMISTHLYKNNAPNTLFSLFNPGIIPNCQLWLDGSDSNNFVLDQNGNVTTWLDKSPLQNHFSGNGQKLINFNNNKKTVNFPSGNIGFMTSLKNYNFTQNSTELFIVAQFTKGLTASATLFATQYKALNFSTGTLIGAPGGAGGNEAEYSGNTNRINASAATTTASTYTNYFLLNAKAGTNWQGSVSDAIAYLGYSLYYNSGPWTGNICEVIAYSSINTDNYTILQGYLAWKWGINTLIPTTHEYYNINPDLGSGFELGLQRNIIKIYPKSLTGNILTNNPNAILRLNTFGSSYNGSLIINDPSYSYVASIKSVSNIGHSTEAYTQKFHPNIPSNGLRLWLDPYDLSTLNLSNNYVLNWNDNSLNQANATTNTINRDFLPTDTSNLVVWFDSKDTNSLTINNNQVIQWYDKANLTANLVLQPHDIYIGPNFSSNGLVFNNFNTGTKTAGQSGLRLNSNVYISKSNKAFYIVYYNTRTTSTAYNDLLQLRAPYNSLQYHLDLGITAPSNGPFVSNSTQSLNTTTTNWSTINDYTILGTFFSNTSVDIRVNGITYLSTSGNTFINQNYAYNQLTVGGHVDNRNFSGTISEILLYEGLTSSDTLSCQKIETYLARKWNLQPNLEPVKLLDITRTSLPSDIPNLQLWLDASDPFNNGTKPSNGVSLSIWYDKSGYQNNGIKYSTNGVPTFNSSTNGLSFNNQMYVLTYPISQIGTVIMVGKQISSNGNLISAQANDYTGYPPYFVAIKSDVSLTVSQPGENLVNFQVLPSSFNTITLFTGIITGTTVSASLNGGANIVSQSYTGTLKKATETYIGASWYNNTVTIAAASEIYEILIFNRALSQDEYKKIEGYLATKWSLKTNLPSNHPNKIGNPITKIGPEPTYDSANGLINFSGNQYLTLPANTIPSSNTDYTIFMYCSALNPTTNQFLLYSGTPRPNNSLNILLNQSNIYNSWDTNQQIANNFVLGNTNVIAELTFSQGRRNTYINGYLVASDITPTRNSTSANNFIGTSSNLTSNLIGKVGDIIIYDRLLSNTERDLVRSFISSRRNQVNQLNTGNLVVWLNENNFTGGNLWLDRSLNRYNTVLETGNSNINLFNNGIILDGKSSWRFPQTGNLNTLQNYTISTWFKKTGNIDLGGSILTQQSSNITNFFITGNFTPASITSDRFSFGYNPGNGYVITNYNIDFPNYTWKNLTLTYGNSNVITYINGVEESRTSWINNPMPIINSYYLIGKSWNANNYVRGELGEIVLYNRELSNSEVLQNYNFSKNSYEFSPLSIDGLQLWLDAADLSTLTFSGNDVTQWADKSGFNRHATKKETNNPTYSATGFNNRPTINFSYGLAYQCPMPAGTTNKFITVFVVFKKTGSAIGDDGLISRTMDTPNGHLPAPIDLRRAERVTNGGVTLLLTDFSVQTARFNNIFSFFMKSGVYEEYNNGQIINYTNTASTNFSDAGANFIYIGTRGDNGVRLSGSISEVLVYNTELTTQERQMVEGYLAWKWGLQDNLLTNHPYKKNIPYLYNKNPIFSGCKLWLDANDYSTFSFNGQNITQWRDKSLEQNHFYLNSNIANCTLNVNSNINVVSIANACILTSTKSLTLTTNTNLLMVVKNDKLSGLSMLFNTIDINNDYSVRYNDNVIRGGPDSDVTGVPNDILGNSINLNASRNTGQSYTNYHIIDGKFNFNGTTRLQISNNYLDRYFIGNIAEIMIFDSLNSTNLTNVQGYLANKWNLTSLIPSTHQFKSINPYPSITLSPININSLVAWYDAFDRNNLTSLNKTNLVTQWNDRSGNNNHATANVSIAPVYDSTRRAILFSNNKFFNINVPHTENLSIFMVCTRSNTTSAYYLARTSISGFGPSLRANYTSTNFEYFDNTNTATINSAPSTTIPFIAGFTFKTGQKVNGYYNSTNVFTINQTNTISNGNYDIIGYNNLNAYIYEILIYNTVLRNTEVSAITSYLKNKWSLNF